MNRCAERLALPGEHARVAADGDEQAAELEPVARVGFDGREDAGDLARPHDPRDRVVDRGAHLGVPIVAEMTKIGGEIARTDEQAVDAVDRRDRFEVLRARARVSSCTMTHDLGVGARA